MYMRLFDFLLTIPQTLGQFANWLLSPLPVINLAPIALFSVAGLTLLITFHLTRLIIGG